MTKCRIINSNRRKRRNKKHALTLRRLRILRNTRPQKNRLFRERRKLRTSARLFAFIAENPTTYESVQLSLKKIAHESARNLLNVAAIEFLFQSRQFDVFTSRLRILWRFLLASIRRSDSWQKQIAAVMKCVLLSIF